MGWLTGIKAILGTPKIINTVADTVKSGMSMWDKSKFTEQEQSEMSLETGKLWLRIQEITANENSLKSITRRWLACGILFNFLFIVNIGVFLLLKGSTEKVTALKEFIVDTNLGWMALTVVIFYFGYYGIQSVRGMKKK